jgi:hypothetical protein
MMYVIFTTQDGTVVAIELDAAVRGWATLAQAFVFTLNKCSDLARKPQIVPNVSDCTIVTPAQMTQWLRQAGVPF